MSRFDDLYASRAAPVLVEHLGHRAGLEYLKPNGQSGGRCQAMLEREQVIEEVTDTGRCVRMTRLAVIHRRRGLPFWLNPPSTAGSFRVDDGDGPVEYAVEALESATLTFARVRLVRRGISEIGRPGRTRR